jgi:hypothetical protein
VFFQHGKRFNIDYLNLDITLHDHDTVRCIQCCYLYALYIQMLTTRTQTQSKALFRNLLQVRRKYLIKKYIDKF